MRRLNLLNKKIGLKVGSTNTEDILGKTLEFEAGSNLESSLTDSKVSYSLKSALTGIESIENTSKANKINLKEDSKGIELTSDSETVTVKGVKFGVKTLENDTSNSIT